MRGADAAIHLAGDYRVGIPASERPAMHDANVGITTRVLDAVETVGLDRLVAVSTVNVFGDTHDRIVDEKYRRDLADGFLSSYDETKFLGHRAVEERIAAGKPIVIAQPGFTYGPGDHSAIGAHLRDAYLGTLHYLVLGQTGHLAGPRRRPRGRHRRGARPRSDRRVVRPRRAEPAPPRRPRGGRAGRRRTAARGCTSPTGSCGARP